MADAADLVGIPFQKGARGPDSYDCYGLLMTCFERDGIDLPDYISPKDNGRIAALIGASLPLWRNTEARPGAAVLFRVLGLPSHVGYVLDRDQFIHTWERSGGVVIERLSDWKQRIIGFYEYVGPHADV